MNPNSKFFITMSLIHWNNSFSVLLRQRTKPPRPQLVLWFLAHSLRALSNTLPKSSPMQLQRCLRRFVHPPFLSLSCHIFYKSSSLGVPLRRRTYRPAYCWHHNCWWLCPLKAPWCPYQISKCKKVNPEKVHPLADEYSECKHHLNCNHACKCGSR